jgi:hypothetical protein
VVQVSPLRRRPRAGLAWLIIIAGVLIALVLGNTIVLAAMPLAGLALVLALRAGAPAAAASQPASARAAGAPRAQRGVFTVDGMARQALVVPAQTAEGYQTVLTVDGYALANAEGKLVYALGRQAHIEASEPVMVTILDDEAVVAL